VHYRVSSVDIQISSKLLFYGTWNLVRILLKKKWVIMQNTLYHLLLVLERNISAS